MVSALANDSPTICPHRTLNQTDIFNTTTLADDQRTNWMNVALVIM